MKTVLCYVPVIQKGYLDFLSQVRDVRIYIWGTSLIDTEPSLRKEIRAMNPDDALTALRALLPAADIRIAEVSMLAEIAKTAYPLVLPEDMISRRLLENVLLSCGLQSYEFHPVFLRWEHKTATSAQSVDGCESVSREQLAFIADLAEHEAAKSSDWWRQVGAALFDNFGNVYFAAHNSHLPTDFAPSIDGDARAAFSRGVNIELTTAIHAEALVIALCAKHGVKTAGMRMLTTTFPCAVCARLIASCGIAELFFMEGYALLNGEKILRDAGVRIIKVT